MNQSHNAWKDREVSKLRDRIERLEGELVYAINRWKQFDDPDEEVNGGDLVEWFGEWRDNARKVIRDR